MNSNYKKLIPTVLLLGLFWPIFDANAGVTSWLINDIAFPAVSQVFSYSLYLMFWIVGWALGWMVTTLSWVVNLRIYTNVPVIQESWKIMRDFANMFFIIALIVMAYGTIFNIKGYDFRSLIPRFLIIALLINFSLVLGGLIIDATQVLNNTFLTAMGDISGRLGQGLNPSELLPYSSDLSASGKAS